MPVERREQATAIWIGSTGNGRNPTFNGRRQPSCGGTSRMTRECHVRICEGLGVKFPGPTRQSRRNMPDSRPSAQPQQPEMPRVFKRFGIGPAGDIHKPRVLRAATDAAHSATKVDKPRDGGDGSKNSA